MMLCQFSGSGFRKLTTSTFVSLERFALRAHAVGYEQRTESPKLKGLHSSALAELPANSQHQIGILEMNHPVTSRAALMERTFCLSSIHSSDSGGQ